MSGMRRREFISAARRRGGYVAARGERTAGPNRMRRIGIIDDAPMWNAFRQGLREHGYLEGQNIAFDYKDADGVPERLAKAAASSFAPGRRHRDLRHATDPGSQGSDGDHPDCHDRDRRSLVRADCGKHRPARW